MKTIKDAILGILVFLAFIAVLKFVFIPSSGHLVPIIEDGESVTGFVYRVDSWWGLVHHEYPASIENHGASYRKSDSEQNAMVPEDAYESH